MIYTIVLSLINKVLQANQSSLKRLAAHAHKSFMFNIAGGIKFSAVITATGLLAEANSSEDVDTTIVIPLLSLLQVTDKNRLKLLQQLHISGNRQFAVELLTIFSQLEVVGAVYSQLPPHYLPAAQLVIKLISSIKDTAKLIYDNTRQTISEYVQYEKPDCMANFKSNITNAKRNQ